MAASKNYILVINPIAGDVDKSEIISAVSDFAEQHSSKIIKYETTGDAEDQTKILELYKQSNPERVLVAGGDGTIKMVAEALEGIDSVIGIIPAGSANGLSVDLGIPTEMAEILQTAFFGEIINVDIVCINNKRSLHLSDIGLNAELIRNYENGTIRGKLGYALQAINTLTDSEVPFTASVTANGQTITSESKMLVVANSQKYGTGVTINPQGVLDDGLFEIIIIKNLDLIVFGKIIAGNMPIDTGDVEIISASQATITTDVPVHFQVDGEYCGEVTELNVKMISGSLKIAVP
ncbi:MAG: YegS/Rv2252/BmrU family lipid kinase [Flavobacterium sp.]|nr:YegS/Rv2252/BmrU family lipid kinase [Flavobacterium sp.]